ncbi:MAG: hypothetical protein NWS20_04630 [Rickettsiaceae bacterium]|nr:hypothetical protein [Rickettsiaceae bacterium]MDP4832854.1 hypothetical protein [Rickettsiaceae bacterium]
MLDKLVIHLKNIIFFKAIIYVVIAIVLFILMPIFKEDLAKSANRQLESQAFLSAATLKLESIKDFEDKILATNEKYKKLMKHAAAPSCFERNKLISNMSLLSERHQLFEPIKIKITRNFDGKNIPNTNGHIQIHYYDIKINFKASDYYSLLTIIREIYLLLPAGSTVTSTKIETLNVLTPDIVDKLNPNQAPGLTNIDIKVKLREVAYEK